MKSELKKVVGRTDTRKRAISVRALLQRLQRVLPQEQKLKQSRPIYIEGKKSYPEDVGRFFIINVSDSVITHHHIDLEAFGRSAEVLEAWETLLIDTDGGKGQPQK